jgi:Riboflavin synthase alpha chain
MFTGLIEETGSILNIRPGSKSTSVSIKASKVLEDANIGDSIAVNGICLTVTSKSADNFTADVMPETIKRTNLHRLTKRLKGEFGKSTKARR